MSVIPERPAPTLHVSPRRYSARLHTTMATVADLWSRLETDGTATAYQRLDWATAVAERLSTESKAEPIIVEVVDANGHPVMLVPLARLRRRGHHAITWLDLGVCDYAAPILAPGFGAQGATPADLVRRFGPQAASVIASESRSLLSAGPAALAETIADRAAQYREVSRG